MAGTWISILPPLVAIALALAFRQVIVALVAAVHEERAEPDARDERDDDLAERERECDRDERRQYRNPSSSHQPPNLL